MKYLLIYVAIVSGGFGLIALSDGDIQIAVVLLGICVGACLGAWGLHEKERPLGLGKTGESTQNRAKPAIKTESNPEDKLPPLKPTDMVKFDANPCGFALLFACMPDDPIVQKVRSQLTSEPSSVPLKTLTFAGADELYRLIRQLMVEVNNECIRAFSGAGVDAKTEKETIFDFDKVRKGFQSDPYIAGWLGVYPQLTQALGRKKRAKKPDPDTLRLFSQLLVETLFEMSTSIHRYRIPGW